MPLLKQWSLSQRLKEISSSWKLNDCLAIIPIELKKHRFSGTCPPVCLSNWDQGSFFLFFLSLSPSLPRSDLAVTPAPCCLEPRAISCFSLSSSSLREMKKAEREKTEGERDREITLWFVVASVGPAGFVPAPPLHSYSVQDYTAVLLATLALALCFQALLIFAGVLFSSQRFPRNMSPYGSVYSPDLFKASTSVTPLLFIPTANEKRGGIRLPNLSSEAQVAEKKKGPHRWRSALKCLIMSFLGALRDARRERLDGGERSDGWRGGCVLARRKREERR